MLRQKKSFYFFILSYLRTKKTPVFARHVFCTVPAARSLSVRFFFQKNHDASAYDDKATPGIGNTEAPTPPPPKETGKEQEISLVTNNYGTRKSKVFQKSNKERNIPSWHIPVMNGAKSTACPDGRAASSPHARSVSARQAGGQYGSSRPQTEPDKSKQGTTRRDKDAQERTRQPALSPLPSRPEQQAQKNGCHCS